MKTLMSPSGPSASWQTVLRQKTYVRLNNLNRRDWRHWRQAEDLLWDMIIWMGKAQLHKQKVPVCCLECEPNERNYCKSQPWDILRFACFFILLCFIISCIGPTGSVWLWVKTVEKVAVLGVSCVPCSYSLICVEITQIMFFCFFQKCF